MQKAVFLDRDGVLNYERGNYSWLPEHFHILPWVGTMLREFRKNGYLLIMISNQGGIARGIYGHEDVRRVHEKLLNYLKPFHAPVNDIFYCPHHPAHTRCLCRKPGSLMFERAIHRHTIDPSSSIMIGDSNRDAEASEKAGIRGIVVPSNTNPLLVPSIKNLLE